MNDEYRELTNKMRNQKKEIEKEHQNITKLGGDVRDMQTKINNERNNYERQLEQSVAKGAPSG